MNYLIYLTEAMAPKGTVIYSILQFFINVTFSTMVISDKK